MKKFRHNFNKGIELHKVCSVDEFRPVMNYVYFENGYAIASNGYILIKAKIDEISNFDELEIEMLNGHFLHAKGFQMLMKHDVVAIEKDGFLAQGDSYSIKIKFYSGDAMKYPSYQKLLDIWTADNKQKIVLNPYILSDVCASVNAKEVRMRFQGADNSGVMLEFPRSDLPCTRGLIMPKLDNDDF